MAVWFRLGRPVDLTDERLVKRRRDTRALHACAGRACAKADAVAVAEYSLSA